MVDNNEDPILPEILPQNITKKTRGPNYDTKFPLPPTHTSFDSHIKALRALNIASNNGKSFAKFDEISQIATMHKDMASKILKFYYDIGMIDREQAGFYKPKNEISTFFQELEWDEKEAIKLFGTIIKKSWFGEYITKIFLMNKEITADNLIANLGRYSGAKNSSKKELEILVKILKYGGIVGLNETTGCYHLVDGSKSHLSNNVKLVELNNVPQNQEKKTGVVIASKKIQKTTEHKEINSSKQIEQKNENFNETNVNLPIESISIQINVLINENSDIDKLMEKIGQLKELVK